MSFYHNLKTCPPELLPFLLSKGSLTALLEQLANQPLSVDVIFEGFCQLNHQQKFQLQLPVNKPTSAWIRKTLLYGDDAKPWVQASSIFPISSLHGDLKRLRHLKSTPIGYVLFKKYRTLPHHRNYYNLPCNKNANTNYGRQTLYFYENSPLLIDECFLTANLIQKIHKPDRQSS